MNIVFGGSFNPPTIAHEKIIAYLYHRFQDATIVLLPNAMIYPRKHLASNNDRIAMLKLIIKSYQNRVIISENEMKKKQFVGTYQTLKAFDDPYFVIGTDSLNDLPTWISYQDLVKDNHFLVFHRDGFDFEQIMNDIPYLNEYRDHFIYLSDFEPIKASSSQFRNTKDFSLISQQVKDYINEHKLY